MPKQHEIREFREGRYELFISTSAAGLEELTLARLVDLAEIQAVPARGDKLVTLASTIYDIRRARSRFFTESLFGEPVWDMLLALYCLPPRGEDLSVTGLSHAAGVPATTGYRWSQLMEQKGLVERNRDRRDGRRVFLRLTRQGEEVMEKYLSSVHDQLTLG